MAFCKVTDSGRWGPVEKEFETMSEWTSERLRERAEQVLNGAGMDARALTAGAQLLVAAGLVAQQEERQALDRRFAEEDARRHQEDVVAAQQRQVEEPGSGKAEPPFAGEFGDGGGAQVPAEPPLGGKTPAQIASEGAPSEAPAAQEELPQF